MLEFLENLPIILTAFLGGSFCFLCTAIGASFVFFGKKLSEKTLSSLLAFAGGIMVASAIFSLLLPSVEYCDGNKLKEFLFVVMGFVAGGFFILLSNLYLDKKLGKISKISLTKRKRNILLASSITLHNIPEGMAIGVALGSSVVLGNGLFIPAILLAIGIGIQNIPEGASVSLPLFRDGVSLKNSFFIGVMSGIVEPIFAVLACLLSYFFAPLLPFLLAFSAGAMLIVSLSELIPESLISSKYGGILFMTLGFALMSLLDILLG